MRAKERSLALEDIKNDSLRGFIQFPQHEHCSSAHFVDATELAHTNGTINIHALYSTIELRAARTELRRQRDTEVQTILASLDEHVAAAKSREAASVPLTFNDIIKALWEYDHSLQLTESELRTQSVFAAHQVHDLINNDIPEPATYRQAAAPAHPEFEQWRQSMHAERDTLEARNTWILVPRNSIGKHKPVRCRYVYRKKRLKDGSLQFKSRLVACGYSQVAGDSFNIDEVYAGVCSYSSFRFLMSMACQENYLLAQYDITGAYLESELHDTVYMEVPPDMRGPNGEPPRDAQGRELVCQLKRGLYGLKQAGFLWNSCFKEFLFSQGFTQLISEPQLF